jgi:uncharacterized protein YaaR (DUF327 family)
MLTAQDLKQIKNVVEEVVERVVERVVDEKLDEKIKFLPTTDIFLTKMDEVMGELQKTREEQSMLSFRVSTHSDQIEELQNIHPNNTHVFAH